MKAVVDTNVFVSSFFGGNPRRIIDLWKTGELTLCLSSPIVEEYVAVLRRLGLEGEDELGELLDLFARGTHLLFAAATPRLDVVAADPADNKFIECAVALHADVIVTGDKALRRVGSYMGIRILSPGEFLKAR
ncbi:MAG TPA: putative toxin-antitoxin system toxin component, PIN family [Candidatus Aminicenantes bacterium]|nr:putative toxin-antitoxin system toxin component, PIN family [Candidatus Aminicenantes bacterium]